MPSRAVGEQNIASSDIIIIRTVRGKITDVVNYRQWVFPASNLQRGAVILSAP